MSTSWMAGQGIYFMRNCSHLGPEDDGPVGHVWAGWGPGWGPDRGQAGSRGAGRPGAPNISEATAAAACREGTADGNSPPWCLQRDKDNGMS